MGKMKTSEISTKPKVGLITTMSPDSTWPDEWVVDVGEMHKQAKACLAEIGMEVLECGEIARTNKEMTAQGNQVRQMGAEVLIIYTGTWTYSSTAVSAALAADVPTIVWADATPGRFGIVGGSITRGALDEMGIKTTLVYGTGLDDQKLLAELKMRLTGIAAATRLRGLTYGVGGARCMGMYTAVIDGNEGRKKFGIEVDGFEQVEILKRAKEMPDEEALQFLSWMKKEFGKIVPTEEVMIAQIKMYLALKNIIKEKGYDFIAVKCLPELPSCYTTFCIAHAMLNDKSDAYGQKESFVCACEADSNGALTMQILKHLSGGPALFADVLHLNMTNGLACLCNCGSQPTDFATSRKEVHWESEGLREFTWKIGGACPQYVAKPGKMTLARIGRIDGEYVMLITTGEAQEFPREKLKEINWYHPQAFVKLDCDPDSFIKCLRSNHIHAVYGDFKEHLLQVCDILDIKPIVP
ncbi:MAG TPA: hypothetical protein ENH84_02290 [Phycisphaerae bacterium]|nr:hypothetical protein [Phycisphaerae bacterium]